MAPYEPPAKHHELICDACDKVLEGEIRNLMIFMPPGSAKSSYASVRFPAYYLGRKPRNGIITASYGDELATAFGRKVRNLVGSQEHQNVFPGSGLAEDSQAKGEWETNEGGSYFAVGVGGGVTGRRADLGLIDDPVKGRKEADSPVIKKATWQWYNADFLTRLKPNAAQIIIQTRWVEDDISGMLLPANWSGESGVFTGRDGKEWTVICLQAQAEEGKHDPLGRKPGEWLWLEWFTEKFWQETQRAQLLSDVRNWTALYQQRPAPEEGTFFKREWFRWYDPKNPPKHLNHYGASDYAVTDGDGDYTEHGMFGVSPEDEVYAMAWWSGRTTAETWIETQIDLMERHEPFIWAGEAGPIKRSIEPFLLKRMHDRGVRVRLEWLPSVTDKPSRARSFQALCSMGKFYLPKGETWAEELLAQLLRFPAGAIDDKVDVCSLLGRMLDQVWKARRPEEKPKRDLFAKPTLNELLNAQPKQRGRQRI